MQKAQPATMQETVQLSEQEEKDHIFSLLIYSLVLKDWQPEEVPWKARRGYNIGTLLVDENNLPVYHGLNAVTKTNNSTQHGEVRAITAYLEKTGRFNLSGFTVYTTLEPCAMCAGMIIMTECSRLVHGQHDYTYSKAIERLHFDSSQIGGFSPYPRRVMVQASTLPIRFLLEEGLKNFLRTDTEKVLAKFLASPAAKSIYEEARDLFLRFPVTYLQNTPFYEAALHYYQT